MAQRVGRGVALLFHDRGRRRAPPSTAAWLAARPGRTLPPRKTRYPFYRRLGRPQGWSGLAENLGSIPDIPVRSSVAIPTELPGPLLLGSFLLIIEFNVAVDLPNIFYTLLLPEVENVGRNTL